MARLKAAKLLIVSMALSVLAVSAHSQELDPNELDPNALLLWGWDGYSEGRQVAADGRAEETHRAEGAEITPWLKNARLPSPDNAALLWYQAFLSRPEPDDATYFRIDEVLRGSEPDDQIRQYLGYCRKTIRLAEMAAQVPQCTWGFSHPDGTLPITDIAVEIRRLTFLLAVDARTLAVDGYCQAAFARCLTIRGLARHVGDDTFIMFLMSISLDGMARGTMQHVLGVLPPEAGMLRWLRGQMTAVEGASESLGKVLQADFEFALDSMRTDAGTLQWIRERLAAEAADEQAEEEAWDLTDEEIIARAREPYSHFLDKILRILDSSMSYEEKCAELEQEGREFAEEYKSDPVAGVVVMFCQTGRIANFYGLLVRGQAAYNALKAAIEVYVVVAETGALPEVLPPHLPKDPFSGESFAYEITADGFLLRCRAPDLYSRGNAVTPILWPEAPEEVEVIQEYEFKVRK